MLLVSGEGLLHACISSIFMIMVISGSHYESGVYRTPRSLLSLFTSTLHFVSVFVHLGTAWCPVLLNLPSFYQFLISPFKLIVHVFRALLSILHLKDSLLPGNKNTRD